MGFLIWARMYVAWRHVILEIDFQYNTKSRSLLPADKSGWNCKRAVTCCQHSHLVTIELPVASETTTMVDGYIRTQKYSIGFPAVMRQFVHQFSQNINKVHRKFINNPWNIHINGPMKYCRVECQCPLATCQLAMLFFVVFYFSLELFYSGVRKSRC